MKIRDISITWQLIIAGITLIVLPVTTLGIWGYKSSEKELYGFIEDKLKEQSAMIVNQLETARALTQEKVDSDLRVAHDILRVAGAPHLEPRQTVNIEAIDQENKELHFLEIPTFLLGDKPVLYQYEVVDNIQELAGGTATIFQMIPEGALRVSTNVLDSNGERAVGTFIPKSSPVYQSVMNGEKFHGRAYVVNAWYQTAYGPIYDDAGHIIGMLYVGVKDASDTILDGLSEIVVGKTGYVGILNMQGEYILSYKRQRDGENIFGARDSRGRPFIQEWLQQAASLQESEARIDYYPWQNQGEKRPRMKVAAYSYFADWEWLIVASAYVEDFQSSLDKLRSITILVSIVSILLGSCGVYFLARIIVNPLFKSIGFAKAIAAGQLSTSFNVYGKNEIGILAHSLRTMQSTIQAVLQEIHGLIQDVQSERLNSRGSAEHFEGGWYEVVAGLNTVMEEIESSVAETKRQQRGAERQKEALEQQNWLKDGASQLSIQLVGELSLQEICRTSLTYTARYVNAGQGALYVYHAEKKVLTLRGTFALTERDALSNHYQLGEGVIGQVALERSPILLKHPSPEESMIRSGIINEAPLNTYTFPLLYNDELYGVLELASFEAFDEKITHFLSEANRIIATALFSALQKEQMRGLLRLAEQDVDDRPKDPIDA